MRVGFFWDASLFDYRNILGNPYGGSLVEALQPHGYTFERLSLGHKDREDPGAAECSLGWVWRNRGRVHALHLHWLQGVVSAPTALGAWFRFATFAATMVLARLLGYQIVWTLHNMLPHERAHRGVDVAGRYLMVLLANSIICHCQFAADEFGRRFRRRRNMYVIPHGNFRSAYPSTLERDEARSEIGIDPDAFVYVSFGNIRGYKGHDDMLTAFHQLKGERLRLLVVGQMHYSYSGPMGQGPLDDPRVIVIEGKVPIDKLQLYFAAADVAVFPYRDALTSGALITALGFGRPVIATHVGCIPELVEESDAGMLLSPGDVQALAEAMEQAQEWDIEARSRSAHAIADRLGWAEIALQTMEAYGPPRVER